MINKENDFLTINLYPTEKPHYLKKNFLNLIFLSKFQTSFNYRCYPVINQSIVKFIESKVLTGFAF
jgi:hypothetical protein